MTCRFVERAKLSRAFFCFILVMILASAYASVALAQRAPGENAGDLRRALAAAIGGEMVETPDQIDSCSGCCSSHGGITSSCAGNGHVICRDGSVSPSCLCSSCGTSP